MPEPNEYIPATVPVQPEAQSPLKKKMPLIIGLGGIVLLFGITNIANLASGNKKEAPKSALATRPSSSNPQQVASFQQLQQVQAKKDAQDLERQQQLAAQMQALQNQEAVPSPEIDGAAPMTPAQRQAIYGNSANAPQRTSNVSQAQAEAKQRALAREKLHQDALASDTVAIDFAHPGAVPAPTSTPLGQQPASVSAEREQETTKASGEEVAGSIAAPDHPALQNVSDLRKADPMGRYNFDAYQGQLYRVFEGTILEGVVTNHIDGGFSGPIILMLTTDYYSHDHQQLLLPQGTRLIGSVQSVNSGQARKLFVTFQRIVCPDGFSLDIAKYVGLDVIGTTGLATKVNNHYLSTFAAAAAIGGLGGLAQIGNNGSVFDASTELRNGMSQQTAQEGEQILQHFLNRLPTITVKEGSRAKVYIGADILIPSYADHRVNPTL